MSLERTRRETVRVIGSTVKKMGGREGWRQREGGKSSTPCSYRYREREI